MEKYVERLEHCSVVLIMGRNKRFTISQHVRIDPGPAANLRCTMPNTCELVAGRLPICERAVCERKTVKYPEASNARLLRDGLIGRDNGQKVGF